jgi:hypothetical protein
MSAHRYHLSTKKASKKKFQGMAKAVKQKKDPKDYFGSLKNAIIILVGSFKKNVLVGALIILVVVGAIVVFLTPVFVIKNIAYDFNDAYGCMTEEQVKEVTSHSRVYPWTYINFNKNDLSNKYKCLVDVDFEWTPLRFYDLVVRVEGQKPVVKIIITKTDISDFSTGIDLYYTANTVEESIRYLTQDGTLINLSDQSGLFTIRYRTMSSVSVDSISLSSEEITKLFQIQKHFQKEYGIQVQPDVTSLGSVKVQLPFVENIYLTLREDLSKQLGSLQAVLSTSTINKVKIKVIDLRYGNPVVRYN